PVWGCDKLVIRAKVIENQIMAASAIAISSDSSDESVGSPPSRVILFGYFCDGMSSPEHISPLPAISPFLCTDSSEAPDSSDGPPSQDPYVATVARWRSRLLTARKRVGPLPARKLAWRHASPRSSDHHPSSSSSSSDSSLIHSSGLDAPDYAHSGSSTRDVSPRLCYPPRRAPRRSEAFRHWCAAPLSTLYPPTTSESSSGDSSERPLHSSSHSAGPSRKRCRSQVDFVPSSTPVMRSLAPTRADLLPSRKRFRDSYSSEASIEEDTELDVRDDTEEYEADTSAGDTVEVGIDLMSAPIVEEEIVEPAGEDSSDSSGTRDGIVRSFEDMPIDLDDVVRDFYHHMSEVRIDRIVGIETVQRRLEADQLMARGQRVSMTERIDILMLENLKVHAMLDIERDRVNSFRLHMSLSQKEFCQVRRDRDDTRGRLRRLESYVCEENGNDNGGGDGNGNSNGNGNGNGTGNGNNGGDNDDGNENRNVNGRGDRPGAHECVVGLIRWSEKMETMFQISNCPERYQVKYTTCTLLDSALTWWNSDKRTIRTDAPYTLSWRDQLKLMTKVFQELTMMCTKMVPEEEDRVDKFIRGLLDNIQGNVIAAEPTRLQDFNTGGRNIARAYMAGNNEKNGYEGTLPFCNRYIVTVTTQGTPRPNQGVVTCFECGAQGHYRKDCPKVKNQNHENKARVPDARGKA
ncbi:putative reverse transcriptase domain-containing protein, partial [Tanacetum coccineum]